ncbi:hypothetical protein LZ31DRAFT_260687 [Colletotrichum somersetense]|nr:hypothetical protein LZ31DRAFT_260687 [Colletotrichum somersetense]
MYLPVYSMYDVEGGRGMVDGCQNCQSSQSVKTPRSRTNFPAHPRNISGLFCASRRSERAGRRATCHPIPPSENPPPPPSPFPPEPLIHPKLPLPCISRTSELPGAVVVVVCTFSGGVVVGKRKLEPIAETAAPPLLSRQGSAVIRRRRVEGNVIVSFCRATYLGFSLPSTP